MITLVYLPHFVQEQHSELHHITLFTFVLLLIIAAGLEAYYYTLYAGQSETHPRGPQIYFLPQIHISFLSLPTHLTRSIMYQVWEGFIDGLVGGRRHGSVERSR